MTHNHKRADWHKEGLYSLLCGILFGSTNTGSTEKPPKPGDPASKKATEMTPQEYAAARKAAISGGARR